MKEQTTNCKRCGKLCRTGKGSPDARIYRRAEKGECTECHAVLILKSLDQMHGGVLFKDGPECLRAEHIQQQFGALIGAAHGECPLSEIDWERVIAVWDLVEDKPRSLF
jgi:hypothetical protein